MMKFLQHLGGVIATLVGIATGVWFFAGPAFTQQINAQIESFARPTLNEMATKLKAIEDRQQADDVAKAEDRVKLDNLETLAREQRALLGRLLTRTPLGGQ